MTNGQIIALKRERVNKMLSKSGRKSFGAIRKVNREIRNLEHK